MSQQFKFTKVANGSWLETSLAISAESQSMALAGTQWQGTCQRCQKKLPAGHLKLKTLPFGKGEEWRCSDCFHPQRKEES